MAKPLRWGILGTGKIAGKFAAEFPQNPRGELAAVGSRKADSAARFAADYQVPQAGAYQDVLDSDDVDAVYLSFPNALHREWTLSALAAGKHVLCEKPIAATAGEAEAMFDAAEKHGRVLIEAFMYRCHPAIQKCIELVHAGALGNLKLIRTHFTFNRPPDPQDVRYRKDLAGGSLMDVGCYCINFARALAGGEPTQSHAVAHIHSTGVDDYAAGTLEFEGRILATFSCGMTVTADRTTYVAGDEGYLTIPFPWFSDGSFELVKAPPSTSPPQPEVERFQIDAPMPSYALEAHAFAEVVQDGKPAWIARSDSLGNMRVLDALRSQIRL